MPRRKGGADRTPRGSRHAIPDPLCLGNASAIAANQGGEGVLRLAFSSDGQSWTEPEIAQPSWRMGNFAASSWSVRHSGPGTFAQSLVGCTASKMAGLHVWCEAAALDQIVFRQLLGVDINILHERPEAVLHTSYSLVSLERPRTKAVVGIALLENGAFGNCLVQYYVAISVARILGLKFIKIPKIDRSQAIFLKERLTYHGITFIPPTSLCRTTATSSRDVLRCTISADGERAQPAFDARGSPLLHPAGVQWPSGGLPGQARGPAHHPHPLRRYLQHLNDPNYPQPPLAFYRMVIERLRAEGRIRSGQEVFENRANPVIPALEAYVESIGLPLTTQSGTLVDDVAAIANGRYLVFGFGSFGPGVCHLSERVDQVFYFSCNWPQGFQSIETVGHVVEVRDVGGGYMKIGEWTNSEPQRRLMVEYQAENLAFDDRI